MPASQTQHPPRHPTGKANSQRHGYASALLALTLAGVPAAQANIFDYILWPNAPKWDGAVMPWRYNPSGQPATVTTDTMLAIINADMAKWEKVCGIHFQYQGTTTAAPTSHDGLNVIGWASAKGYDGYTQYWYSNYKFTDVDIRLDPSRLTNPTYIEAILTHELGHAVGLDHSDQNESTMFANPYHTYDYQLTLRDDDAAGCVALYGAAATPPATTPYAFSATAGGAAKALTLDAQITIASTDLNATGNIYLAFHGDTYWLVNNGTGWTPWNGGALPVYYHGTLTDRTIRVISGFDTTSLIGGGSVIVGYGRNEAEMLASGRYGVVHTFP
ncbi:MAG: M57 family metalloprotease [Sulfuricellaceae bacterium]